MDSSASNAVANNKDVPSSMTPTAVEDDGAMSVNSGLAKEAALFFQSGNYADCVRVLYQLLQKKEGDPKVTKSVFFLFLFLWYLYTFSTCCSIYILPWFQFIGYIWNFES